MTKLVNIKRVTFRPGRQSGVVLMEVLVAVLVFSVGILGVIGMQAASASAVTDAKYRSEAAMVANQIIARMWADQSNITGYAVTSVALAASEANLPDGHKTVVVGNLEPIDPLLIPPPPAVPATMRTITVTIDWTPPHSGTTHTFVTETQISSAI